jgi:sugar fermentation stimulation protein A
LVSPQSGKNRKLAYTWEMVWTENTWVGTNTHWPNPLVQEGFDRGMIPALAPYKTLRREVAVSDSRLDFYATDHTGHGNDKGVYVEVKNVHSKKGTLALFPDAVTTRGAKHLRTLTQLAAQGYGAVMIYVIQRNDCTAFAIDAVIDPDYAKAFKEATGVAFFAYTCDLSPQGISLGSSIPVLDPC